MNEIVENSLLNASPKLIRNDEGYLLRVRAMTPLRVSLLYEALIFPLYTIWGVTILWFLGDCIFWYSTKQISYFNYLQWNRFFVFAVLIAAISILTVEIFGRYPLARRIIGRRITIRITDNHLIIKTGLSSDEYDRHQRLSFVNIPFEGAITAPYRNSRLFCLIIGDTRKVEISEIYDVKYLEKIVNNANVALGIASLQLDLDIDPAAQPNATTASQQPNFLRSLKKWIPFLRR